MVISGKLNDGVSFDKVDQAIWEELELLKSTEVAPRELQKIQHRFESTVVFSETSALNKAQNLAYYEHLDKAELLNEEVGIYLSITPEHMHRCAQEIFQPNNSATLVYVPALSV